MRRETWWTIHYPWGDIVPNILLKSELNAWMLLNEKTCRVRIARYEKIKAEHEDLGFKAVPIEIEVEQEEPKPFPLKVRADSPFNFGDKK